jgi:hypothetical protein
MRTITYLSGTTMSKHLKAKATTMLILLLVLPISSLARGQDARVAIIDSSENTKGYVKDLAALGVVVIGRYYARCPQWNFGRTARLVPEKRMIDNLDEVDAILGDERLSILSVYQFYSQAEKFDTNRSVGQVSVLDDQPRKANPQTVQDFNDCITPELPNKIEEDAKLDGYAAVAQAREIIKQPAGTAIYFGVDFDLNGDRRANVLKYFRVLKKIVTDAGYVMGVYGNGAISDLLHGENLVTHVWLTASPAHAGSARTYNIKHWDLLQTKTDIKWEVAGKKVELDTNIQNPKSKDIGLWRRSSSFIIPHDRNKAVHSARRFVCEGRPLVVDDAGNSVTQKACTTTFGIVVRTFKLNAPRTLAQVDCDEDGHPDGWMKVKDLSQQRPIWVNDAARARTHCTSQ